MLKRKIDQFLLSWKNRNDHNPLIVYGARQIGKTTSIKNFGNNNYDSLIEINFIENPQYKECFKNKNVDSIVKNLSVMNPNFKFIPKKTLIFFDEIQDFMDATTSLKFFAIDNRYDVICSGSALGVNNQSISSVSVGYKEEYIMYSLDFEEFLWAKGYNSAFIDDLLNHMVENKPFSEILMKVMQDLFDDYVLLGGYPKIVNKYIEQGNFSYVLDLQKQIRKDYRDDLSKYLSGLEITKAQRVYDSITSQLAKENHKFQFSKLGHGARFNDYFSVAEWIKNAGIAIIANNLSLIELPLKGNEEIDNFRMYYSDTSLLISSLDDFSQKQLRIQKDYGIYKGALYENVVADALNKQGLPLMFYRSKDSTIELDFVLQIADKIVPIEVKSKEGRSKSLTNVMDLYQLDLGIKFSRKNIGTTNKIINFPMFLAFLLKRYFLSILEKI